MRSILLALLVVAPATDDAIVRQFFPAKLTAEIDPDHPVQKVDYARADLDGTGRNDYIVAVYYNGMHDVLRVSLISPARRDHRGRIAGTLLGSSIVMDTDGDGVPEILDYTRQESGDSVYVIYKLKGGKLTATGTLTELPARRPAD